MPQLILLRHAKAESVSSTGRDFDRGLTERGHRDAAIMGRVLAQAGFAPDLVLVSTARRALETWEGVAPAFPAARVEEDRALYLASREQLAEAARDGLDSGALMIVGHNPGLHELALMLAGSEPDRLDSFPTAAAAVFDMRPGKRPLLQRMLVPRDHGGGSL
ncbi:SixA phosphatase family protein [Phenylobacterium montanum]|uniref:Histidine phosphatase family protein n=1 Tax=Phenylobacterium montanum TaxID=2823693 RepID=A0A975FWC2_9CAUL|nr:histidine phosphatase family protein [Caulobacter sp. S6]QUD86500.1 histidine phosphatase family protein [Caulobacter sp. S6]